MHGGGTVVADYWTALLDEHGVGRLNGGGLDQLFGLHRDEQRGYFDGATITEIDGERYNRPFLERLPADNVWRSEGKMIVERGTTAVGSQPTGRVNDADVVLQRRVGRGTAIYLNLTPVEYYDNSIRLDSRGQQWRGLLGRLLRDAGLEPRAAVLAQGTPLPLVETLFWRGDGRLLLGVVKNPSRQATVDRAATADHVTGPCMDVDIQLSRPYPQIRNLRTGQMLPAGNTIHATWKPSEALVFELRRSSCTSRSPFCPPVAVSRAVVPQHATGREPWPTHRSMDVLHLPVRRRSSIRVRVLGFDQADGEGEGDADQEGGRQFDAVVVVELDLGQNVRQRDAQEHAGRKPERTADRNVLACPQLARAEIEQQRTRRTDQREQQIHDVARSRTPMPHRHHGRDRQRIERLVEQDRQERANAQ